MARQNAETAGERETAPSQGTLDTLEDAFALQRAVFLDWPLMVAMEATHFAVHAVEAGMRHWCALAACETYPEVIAENRRFATRSADDLAEEMDVLTRETALTLNVH